MNVRSDRCLDLLRIRSGSLTLSGLAQYQTQQMRDLTSNVVTYRNLTSEIIYTQSTVV